MRIAEAVEMFHDWSEERPEIDAGEKFLQITGLPIWWDRVGAEWRKAARRLIKWADDLEAQPCVKNTPGCCHVTKSGDHECETF